jgi:hypothetical protein
MEFCDETGRVIARLIPSTPWDDPDNWADMVELTPPVSDEELQRRLNSNEPTYSTQELIERIKRMKGLNVSAPLGRDCFSPVTRSDGTFSSR